MDNFVKAILSGLLIVWVVTAGANDGYEVTGHLTYTGFDATGKPRLKSVLMFQVQVANGRWRIFTEPVMKVPKGIGYHEASGGSNDSVFALTAFQTPEREAKSPLEPLRGWLMKTNAAAVFFTNPPPPQMPAEYARLFAGSDTTETTQAFTSHAHNVAVATFSKGKFPPISPSQIGFLWFAFTPPEVQRDGTNQLLFQIWDDGNPTKRRFRQAHWRSFSEAPQLVSRADYIWPGWQLLEDGRRENLRTSDVSNPLLIAARYEVITSTNLGTLLLPQHFTLTRYATLQTGSETPRIVSTLTATTVNTRSFSPTEPLQVTVPGKTYVSDYRGSGRPDNYFLDSDGQRSARP